MSDPRQPRLNIRHRESMYDPLPAEHYCISCGGSKKCRHCNGTGYSEEGSMDDGYKCPYCRRSPGKCSTCEGSGLG